VQHVLHFTLGPVQGFVAEARRTRDLWAGSFLLSWLSAHAMLAVERAGGVIVFPEVATDPLMLALRSGGTQGCEPHIGSVPNRFKAQVPAGFDVSACTNAVHAAWRQLAFAVWENFVQGPANYGIGTEIIWDRQVGGFWDMAWVMAPDPGDRTDGAWLDLRKNWRSHVPTIEGGDHCQLMGQFQELSGYTRSRGPDERTNQDAFWRQMQRQRGVGPLNLRDRERLSAIALIKRLFVCLPAEVLIEAVGWQPGGSAFNVQNWPSVSYIAAAPWILASWKLAEDKCRTLHHDIEEVMRVGIHGETETRLFGEGPPFGTEGYFKLDGHLFHADAIRSMDLSAFSGATDADKQRNRAAAVDMLDNLCNALVASPPPGGNAVGPRQPASRASEFYAVLLCDGDQIGANLRKPGGESAAKAGLAKFTREVPAVVQRNMGVTIYAGGDDLLALVPLDRAMIAAGEVRSAYRRAFDEDADHWTLSASVVFARYSIPIRAVLRQAHEMLDKVAKDRNGRDSLAVSVLKPSGEAFNWVSTWSGSDERGPFDPPGTLDRLARTHQQDREITTSFFYKVRERYAPLFESKAAFFQDGKIDYQMARFLEAEYRASGGEGDGTALVADLMRVALPFERQAGKTARSGKFSFDAGLTIRFLAEEGRWFMTP